MESKNQTQPKISIISSQGTNTNASDEPRGEVPSAHSNGTSSSRKINRRTKLTEITAAIKIQTAFRAHLSETDSKTETVGSSYLTDMPLLSLRDPISTPGWEGVNTMPRVKTLSLYDPHLSGSDTRMVEPSSNRGTDGPPSRSSLECQTGTFFLDMTVEVMVRQESDGPPDRPSPEGQE
ncbi:hypothetical protein CQW23_06124 [Capsicum baccatum]|uniref:Uncharacterized protein n=1 Tax=Capsicum baccatum TaxID=33114 RepID=A0A2G2X2E5_CAPBA|nr:hypothetical protein CQW23_06124 [Capsicum baccatum]